MAKVLSSPAIAAFFFEFCLDRLLWQLSTQEPFDGAE